MRPVTLLAAVCMGAGACVCATTVEALRFACASDSDCAEGFVCRAAECHPADTPPEVCFPGEEPRACALAGCAQVCGDDGFFRPCTPSAGPGLDANPAHCGSCGRACSARLGAGLGCVAGRCSCSIASDCPPGTVCAAGGLCAEDDGSDPCARVACPRGQVCRAGACAPVACASGCLAGEVCDVGSGTCRPIDGCRLPAACGDGGVCEGPAKPDSEPCDDGQPCTFADQCRAGACAGSAYSCPAPDQCQLAVACAGDGGCEVTPQPDGLACDDGLACSVNDVCTGGGCAGAAPVSFADADRDGVGNTAAAQSVCPVPAGNVLDGGDCDDGNANVYQSVSGLRDDPDHDGYSNLAAATYCVGASVATDAGTWYLGPDGGAPYTAIFRGADCDNADSSAWRLLAALVQDNDQDGYPPNNNQSSRCVGDGVTVAGRRYYSNGSGGFWMQTFDCINKNGGGTQCQPPYDVDDSNGAVH